MWCAAPLVLLVPLLAPSSAAQDTPWVETGPHFGTRGQLLQDLEDPDRILAFFAGRHPFLTSEDGGASFSVDPGDGSEILAAAQDPDRPDRMLGFRRYVIVGDQWTPIRPHLAVVRSMDGGQSWHGSYGAPHEVGDDLPRGLAIEYGPAFAEVRILSSAWFVRSFDTGWSFGPEIPPPAGGSWTSMAHLPGSPDRTFLGWGGGLEVLVAGSDLPQATPFQGSVRQLLALPGTPGRLLVAADEGLFLSDDAGATFSGPLPGLPLALQSTLLELGPWPSMVSLGLPDGRWVSMDRGASWSHAGAGGAPPLGDRNLLRDLLVTTGGDLLASVEGPEGGVFRRPVGSLEWTRVGAVVPEMHGLATIDGRVALPTSEGVFLTDGVDEPACLVWWPEGSESTEFTPLQLLADPDDPGAWLVVGKRWSEVDGDEVHVVRRYQAGGTTHAEVLQLKDDLFLVRADPFRPARRLAMTSSSILESWDRGASWTTIATPFSGGAPVWTGLAFDPFRIDHVAARGYHGEEHHHSYDGGRTWTSLPWLGWKDAGGLQFDPNQPDRMWANDSGVPFQTDEVHVSDDGGLTWTEVTMPSTIEKHWVMQSGAGVPASHPGWVVTSGVWCFWVRADPDQGFVEHPLDTGSLVLLGPQHRYDPGHNVLHHVVPPHRGTFSLPDFLPVHDLGGATPGTGRLAPRLWTTGGLPRLGHDGFGLSCQGLLGGARVVLALGLGASGAELFGGVQHPAAPWVLAVPLVAGGTWGQPGVGRVDLSLAVPADPALAGLELRAQAMVRDPGAEDPSGLVLSNGLWLELWP